jgi:hypothetical protein
MRLLATVVVRSAHPGESHGAVYLIDAERGTSERAVDWAHNIDWSGRGADRGLRGICFHRGLIYIAASSSILAFDSSFRNVRSFHNTYLRHCHEIMVAGDTLWATSTGFDSLLELDLVSGRFTKGHLLRISPLRRVTRRLLDPGSPVVRDFDPNSPGGPRAGDTIHLNNVFTMGDSVACSGAGLPFVLALAEGAVSVAARIPYGTHNVQPFRDGLLMNHTRGDAVRYAALDGCLVKEWPVPAYDPRDLVNGDLPLDHARPGFGRGLCVSGSEAIFGGCSPATVARYDLDTVHPMRVVNLSMDVRFAVHGLEVYPELPLGQRPTTVAGQS